MSDDKWTTDRVEGGSEWKEDRIDADPNRWKKHLSKQEADDLERQVEAVRNDPSLTERDRVDAWKEIEYRFFKRAAESQGLKEFAVEATVKFFLLAESREEAEEKAVGLFDFDADLHLDVEERE